MSTPEESLADQFRHHFGHREHLYGVLLAELADDLDAGGPTAEICRDHLNAARGDAVQLRLLAGIFRLVLSGRASQLEPFYPCLGGTEPAEGMWPLLRPVLAEHADELRAALNQAPQTNEVGRAACLLVGLSEAVRRTGLTRIRLLELGASAGLNLNVDHFRITGPGWASGPADSPLVIGTGLPGLEPVPFEIVERRGCDLAPVSDPVHLTSFVWPFDLERHRRLAGALEVAARHPVSVDAAPASAWVAAQLAQSTPDDVLTVVWQSITEQYWPAEESAEVTRIIEDARSVLPVVRVAMEGVPPPLGLAGYSVAEHGPELRVDGEVIARSHHHGPPIVLVG